MGVFNPNQVLLHQLVNVFSLEGLISINACLTRC